MLIFNNAFVKMYILYYILVNSYIELIQGILDVIMFTVVACISVYS